jgi:hypothetical protein
MHVPVLKCLISSKFLMNSRADLQIALSAPPLRFYHHDSGLGRQDRPRERLNKGLAMEKWNRNFVSQRQGGRLCAGFGRIRLPVRRTGAVRALYAAWQRSR